MKNAHTRHAAWCCQLICFSPNIVYDLRTTSTCEFIGIFEMRLFAKRCIIYDGECLFSVISP